METEPRSKKACEDRGRGVSASEQATPPSFAGRHPRWKRQEGVSPPGHRGSSTLQITGCPALYDKSVLFEATQSVVLSYSSPGKQMQRLLQWKEVLCTLD